MDFFQHGHFGPAPADKTFTNLFRLLDDFDAFSREASNNNTHYSDRQQEKGGKSGNGDWYTSSIRGRPFNPRFDIQETENTYELHGELAGVDRKEVTVEFTGPQTITVSGDIQRIYSTETPTTSAPSEAEVRALNQEEAPFALSPKCHATVSDQEAEDKERKETVVDSSKKGKEVLTPHASEDVEHRTERYWVTERAVGQFQRTFNFPRPVDEDNAKATLQNGILSISIPKLKRDVRRIAIQ